jgi:hypothetical protein
MIAAAGFGCMFTACGDSQPTSSAATVAQKDTFCGAGEETCPLKEAVDWAGAVANFYGVYQLGLAAVQQIVSWLMQGPDPSAALLAGIAKEINPGLAANIWFQGERDRETNLSNMLGDLSVVSDKIRNGTPVDWNTFDKAEQDAALTAGNTTQFETYATAAPAYNPGPNQAGPFGFTEVPWQLILWNQITKMEDFVGVAGPPPNYGPLQVLTLSDLQPAAVGAFDASGGACPGCGDTVYDWRLGLPAFLMAIALRLQFMALEHPAFMQDGYFHDELMQLHDRLSTHLQALLGGIRCASMFTPSPYINLVCADIFSGNSEQTVLQGCDENQATATLPYCNDPQGVKAFQQSAPVVAALEKLYIDVLNQSPWFTAQVMLDTLYKDANGLPDLDSFGTPIFPVADSSLCISTLFAFDGPPYLVNVSDCNWDSRSIAAPMQWRYDRTRQRVINDPQGLCLVAQPNTPNPEAETNYVGAAPCDDTPADPAHGVQPNLGSPPQRWDFQPQTGALRNALTTVLDVPNDNFAPGQLLWTYAWNGSRAQQWAMVSQACTNATNCSFLLPGQSLAIGQTMLSPDARFTLILQTDNNLVLYQNGVGSLWATNTSVPGELPLPPGTPPPNLFEMTTSGEPQLINSDTTANYWHPSLAAGFPGNGNGVLALQNDGNLVLYSYGKQYWASNTCCH